MLLLLDPEHVFADLECVPVLQTFGRRLVRGVVRAVAHEARVAGDVHEDRRPRDRSHGEQAGTRRVHAAW